MTKEMGFLIALCATSAVCYALLTRVEWIRTQRRLAGRRSSGASSDGGMSENSDTWSMASWFSGGDASSCSTDSSGNPVDFGSCGGSSDSGSGDSGGGGGDCGGGGGGGTD